MSHLARLSVGVMFFLAACGGKSIDELGTEAGGSGGSGARAGAGPGGGSGARAGTGPGGGSSPGGASAGGNGSCDALNDDAPAYIPIQLLNKTSATIYLGQQAVSCSEQPVFEVRDARGGLLPPLGDCRSPCESVRKGGPAGCAAICRLPSAVALLPGAVMTTSYSGLFSRQIELASQCLPRGYDALSCDRAQRIEPGVFTFSAAAGSELDCSSTINGKCTVCPIGVDTCSIDSALVAGKLITAKTEALLAGDYGIYSTDPGPGMQGAAPAPPSIQLVFTE